MTRVDAPSIESSLSQAGIEIRKTIVKDQLRLDVPIAKKRREWEEAALSIPLQPGVDLETESIEGVPCLWVREENSLEDYVVVYMHGGGLVEGSATTSREFASRLTKTLRIPVLLVDYRLAPEYPFPAALNDVKVVYRSLLSRYSPEQIIFGGDSNGSGLALASLVSLRDEGEKLPASLFAISPVVDLSFSGESMTTRAALDPFTSEEALKYCAELYTQGGDVLNPLVSPLFADLSAMPSALIQVGDHEILLSDSVRLAKKLEREGSKVSLKIWNELWHVWHYHPALPEAQQAIDEIRDFLYQELRLNI